jgi:hypothetical protein
MEKEFQLEYAGKLEKFVFRPLTFGEKNRLTEDSTDVKIVGGQELVKVSITKLVEGAILKCLVSAPFAVNSQNIQSLSAELGERISEIVTEINYLGKKKSVS